jgi:hypothetical protein
MFLNMLTKRLRLRIINLFNTPCLVLYLMHHLNKQKWSILYILSTNILTPSQTRRWSRLKPTVMVGDKQNKTRQQNSVEIEAYLNPEGFSLNQKTGT